MAEIYCGCKSCEIERNNLQKQLDHPFYKKVDDFRDEIKAETMAKAAKKYNEPFNPASWSVKELGKHAMAENYDQGNYIVGLMDKALELEKALVELANVSAAKIQELERELRAIKEKGQDVTIAIPEVKITVDPPKIDNKKLFNDIKKALGENLDAKG